MADSTTNLDLISSGQAQKEIGVNALFDAASKSMLYGRRFNTTSALTWGYYGGKLYGASQKTPNGTINLTPNAVNFIEADPVTGAVSVSVNAADFTNGKIPLYRVVTGASTVTSYEDYRPEVMTFPGNSYASATVAGIIKVGAGLTMDVNGVLSNSITNNNQLTNGAGYAIASALATVATTGKYTDLIGAPGAYSLPQASPTVLGGIKLGTGLTAAADGTVSVTGGSGGGSIAVQDEGTQISPATTILNFVGAGVTASGNGTVTITVPGASGGSAINPALADFSKITAFYKPKFGSQGSTISFGTWTASNVFGFTGGDTSAQGKWGSYNRAILQTTSVAGNTGTLYISSSGCSPFRRDPNAINGVSAKFGASPNGSASSTNTTFAFAMTTGSFNSNPTGSSADFSGIALTTNYFGIGCRVTDTNLQLIYRTASGVALTFFDTGLPRFINGSTGQIAYDCTMEAINSATDIKFTIRRIDTGVTYTWTITCYTVPGQSWDMYPCLGLRTNEAVLKEMHFGDFFMYQYPNPY